MRQPATRTASTPLRLTSTGQPADCSAGCVKSPDQTCSCIAVDLLGGLRVRAGRMTISPRELGGTKLRRVLLALLLHRGSPVSKDLLVALLWEGSPPPGAMATLESYVCVLRKKLHPCHRSRSSLITTTAGCYAIDMSRVDLDLVRYERLLAAALQPGTTAADALPIPQQAMAMAESPLLPEEINCEWLDEERRSHTQNVLRDHVAAANKVAGLQSGSAQRWARVALDEDPLDESAWQALLRGMEASGQHAEGLRAYDQCRRLFAAELGCSPGPMLQQLYARLLQGANENDDGLTLLLDAVVRLHAMGQPGSRPQQWALGSARHDARGQVATIAQARRTLELLLSRVGTDRLPRLGVIVHRDVEVLRDMVTALYPRGLDPQSLAMSLRDLGNSMRRTGVQVDVDADETLTLDETTAALVYRVARESMHNVQKHAQAHHVEVHLSGTDTGAVLTVVDDGRGFDPGAEPGAGHLGLKLIADTVDEAGGELRVESATGRGTRVELRLPGG